MAHHSLWAFLRGLASIIASRPLIPRTLADNELLRTILQRRSVRRYRDDPLPDDVVAAILEAGRLAPSTVNLQTWSFATFTRDAWREFFAGPLPFGAPFAVVVLADVGRAKRVVTGFPSVPLCEYTVGVTNAALAAMNMTIAAEALGVSSVMLSETGRTGFYDAGFLSERMALPAGVIPLLTVCFGYGRGGRPAMPPKLPLDAVAFSGRYRATPQDVLDDWYAAMQAGFQVSNLGRPFSSQIAHYNRRLTEAEADLYRLVLGAEPPKP
jgi:nitroreductase